MVHRKKGYGLTGHSQHNQRALPVAPPPVPDNAHVGVSFSPAAIIAATKCCCKLLGQGGCGKVFAAEMPQANPKPLAGQQQQLSAEQQQFTQEQSQQWDQLQQHQGKKYLQQEQQQQPGQAAVGRRPAEAAIKTALPSRNHRRSLVTEACALRLTAHPAIVKLLGTCWSNELDALVYELLPGGDLAGRIGLQGTGTAAATAAAIAKSGQQQGSTKSPLQEQKQQDKQRIRASKVLSWQQRLLMSYQLASALASLHCCSPKQVLHRDIKPENVLLDSQGNAKLTDFGIATVVDVAPAHVARTAAAAAAAESSNSSVAVVGSPMRSPVGSPQHQLAAAAMGGSNGSWAQRTSAHQYAPHVGSPQSAAFGSPSWPMSSSSRLAASHGHQLGSNSNSKCQSAAAEAVLARLAARGVGGTTSSPAAGHNSSREAGRNASTATSSAAGASAGSVTAASGGSANNGGGAVVQQHGWAGTHQYLDPMYEQLGQLCDKSDVYGLGLIMCQLIMDCDDPKQAKRVLQHTVHDKGLHLPAATAGWPAAAALTYADLALHCAAADRHQRPTSAQLAGALRQLVLQANAAGGSVSSSTSGSAGSNAITQLIKGCANLEAGRMGLVPAALHAAPAFTAAAASTAAAAALGCCQGAGKGNAQQWAGSVLAHTGSHNASNGQGKACNSNSKAQGPIKVQQEQQQQQQRQLERFAAGVMSVELVLNPSGAVSGGCIMVAHKPCASAIALASGQIAAKSVAFAAAKPYLATSSSQRGAATGGGSSTTASHEATASTTCVVPAPCISQVKGGVWSADSDSIVFYCNKTRPQGPLHCTTAATPSTAAAVHPAVAAVAREAAAEAAAGDFVFAGQYTDGQLLGEWRCLPASDNLLHIHQFASVSDGSRSKWCAAAAAAVPACYHWVMLYRLEDSAPTTLISVAAAAAVDGNAVGSNTAAAAQLAGGAGSVQPQQACAFAVAHSSLQKSASGSLLPVF